MADAGTPDTSDVLIVHGRDGHEWCIYLKDLFLSSDHVRTQHILSYQVDSDATFHSEDLQVFRTSRCILLLLSQDLLNSFSNPSIIRTLQRALRPPQKVVVLFCGVPNSDRFEQFFEDWFQWKHLSCEDDADAYITAVRETIMEDTGCECATDTEAEAEKHSIYSKEIETFPEFPTAENEPNNLSAVLPGRIRCGVKTMVYIIVKCKLGSNANIEVEFNSRSDSPQRIQAILENEYTIRLHAPDLPPGLVYLEVYCDDEMVCSGQINYYTDMEEIRSLLDNATNPVEFMCQAFKIVPYSIDTLDKLLTESLKNNIPASGLHLFGVHQIEEEDMSANQRDDELPTLLHFAAKYGLKNLTALLLTCPGALQAYSVCNKHGDFPNGIAEKHGFKDLRQFMDDYVETVGMLKSHFKEEMMQKEDEDGTIYEPMADVSTELLMKCSLNPGCNEDFYESMVGLTPQYASEDIYVQMVNTEPDYAAQPDLFSMTSKESIIRKFLKENSAAVPDAEECSSPHFVKDDPTPPEIIKRPPRPAPRPESSNQPEENQLYISKVFAEKAGKKRAENIYIQQEPPVISRRDREPSNIYDPFAGMKTPGQRQLITLQEQVKSGMITVDEAVLRFKEWHLNERRRSESFKYQQENLQRLRDSITRRQGERRKKGKLTDLTITKPMKSGQDMPSMAQYDIYEYCPKQTIEPPKKGIQRGTWNTESSSSTASSASNRSSTRSTLSFSSGMEGDSEDNEMPETRTTPRAALPPLPPPPGPPRTLPRNTNRPSKSFSPPPVPPRGR